MFTKKPHGAEDDTEDAGSLTADDVSSIMNSLYINHSATIEPEYLRPEVQKTMNAFLTASYSGRPELLPKDRMTDRFYASEYARLSRDRDNGVVKTLVSFEMKEPKATNVDKTLIYAVSSVDFRVPFSVTFTAVHPTFRISESKKFENVYTFENGANDRDKAAWLLSGEKKADEISSEPYGTQPQPQPNRQYQGADSSFGGSRQYAQRSPYPQNPYPQNRYQTNGYGGPYPGPYGPYGGPYAGQQQPPQGYPQPQQGYAQGYPQSYPQGYPQQGGYPQPPYQQQYPQGYAQGYPQQNGYARPQQYPQGYAQGYPQQYPQGQGYPGQQPGQNPAAQYPAGGPVPPQNRQGQNGYPQGYCPQPAYQQGVPAAPGIQNISGTAALPGMPQPVSGTENSAEKNAAAENTDMPRDTDVPDTEEQLPDGTDAHTGSGKGATHPARKKPRDYAEEDRKCLKPPLSASEDGAEEREDREKDADGCGAPADTAEPEPESETEKPEEEKQTVPEQTETVQILPQEDPVCGPAEQPHAPETEPGSEESEPKNEKD